MSSKTKKLTTMAMICALAYLVMVIGRFPVVLFLKYDPKDVVITIGGFLLGPMTALATSLLVSVVEMFTVSDTGIIGLIMNVLATCAFACTASVCYKKIHTARGALLGLAAGTALMTLIMLLWNYLITPLYMGLPREEVAKLLLPAFLPFNLLKGGLNTAITLLIYKPVARALRKAQLLAPSANSSSAGKSRFNPGLLLVAALLLLSCVLVILALQGRL